jgi:hypothetical protein
MITFKYNEERTSVTHICDTAHLDGIVEDFRTFLHHIGHHPENVERVVLQGREEKQGLPVQLELPL